MRWWRFGVPTCSRFRLCLDTLLSSSQWRRSDWVSTSLEDRTKLLSFGLRISVRKTFSCQLPFGASPSMKTATCWLRGLTVSFEASRLIRAEGLTPTLRRCLTNRFCRRLLRNREWMKRKLKNCLQLIKWVRIDLFRCNSRKKVGINSSF